MSNMKHIDTLDDKGIEMINTIIDTQIANGVPISDALVDFSYEPPAYDAPCEVKASKYGNGLFASRDIKRGEVVTLFPVHMHLSAPDKNGGRDGRGGVNYDVAYFLEHVPTNTIHQGDKEKTDPLFLGHIVNDFCTFVEEFQDKKRHGETMMKYFIYAISFQNVEFVMGNTSLISKRPKTSKRARSFSSPTRQPIGRTRLFPE